MHKSGGNDSTNNLATSCDGYLLELLLGPLAIHFI